MGSEKGIALITTIVLSTLMMSSIFLVSREMISEAKNTSLLGNSSIAYYVSEAGIEDALLEWRYTEKKEAINIKNVCKVVSGDSSDEIIEASKCGLREDQKYFKLNISTENSPAEEVIVYRDDVYQIDLPQSGNINVDWEDIDTAPDSKNVVEFSVFNPDGSLIEKRMIDPSSDSRSFSINSTQTGILRIKPWYVKNSKNGEKYSEGTNENANKVPGIKITSISGNGAGISKTKISSIGYYGGVARKIDLELDSSSGKVLNVFDYAIYSEKDLVK